MQNNYTPAEGKDSAQTESESALRDAACSANLSDGGAAFPVHLSLRQSDGQPMTAAEFFEGGNGMTLRDYFAAQALAGICATNQSVEYGIQPDYHWDSAKRAYGYADAMLAFRCKQNAERTCADSNI